MLQPRLPLSRFLWLLLAAVLAVEPGAQAPGAASGGAPPLVFPGLLAKAERETGNPLATYARMVELADRYLASPFAPIYPEVRANYEEFLGVPLAGVRAMSLPVYARGSGGAAETLDPAFEARDALAVIVAAAARTQLVVFGEEHHLPQTRSLYEPLLRALWQLGYRYLAAETFAEEVMAPAFSSPDYGSGYYLMDPVFAHAVRTARALGYRLIAYEATKAPPPGDGGYRDRKQAENLHARTFAADPKAKVLVLCGRGHAAEVSPADGWRPMPLGNLRGLVGRGGVARSHSRAHVAWRQSPLARPRLLPGRRTAAVRKSPTARTGQAAPLEVARSGTRLVPNRPRPTTRNDATHR